MNLAQDAFGYGDGVSIDGHTIDAGGYGWNCLEGDFESNSFGRCVPQTLNGSDLAVLDGLDVQDVYVQAKVYVQTALLGQGGVVARVADASNYYLFRQADTDLQLYKRVSGTPTLIASDTGIATNTWQTFKMVCVGTNPGLIYCYLDDVLQFGGAVSGDNALDSGSLGIRSYKMTAYFDDFEADDYGAAPAGNRRRRLIICGGR